MTHKPIPDSQLPLNADGSVYHLRLMPEQVATDIILVGDPKRVSKVSAFFDEVEFEVSNREIITHTGYYRGKRITVLSTGMGTDNIDIVVNELDALFNIDLKTRIPKAEHTRLRLIRLGTSGALQPDVPVGDSVVASEYALGLDGLLYFYEGAKEVMDQGMKDAFLAHTEWNKLLPHPYVVRASDELLQTIGQGYLRGVTATAPGFYGPQGRSLRLRLPDKLMNSKMESFAYSGHRITNFEMESSALYGLSKLLGHDALTLCVIIANRVTEKFAPNYQPYMEKLIRTTLDRLAST
ncbi:MAG: nucleoside phosphorylase [Bacteroidetes bacterium]|nr:nucleoside phosphorylase [Bacteroidota bacterium]